MRPDELSAWAAVVSALAALVSVVGLVASLWLQWRSGKPAVRVFTTQQAVMGQSEHGWETRHTIQVVAVNFGSVPVVVTAVRLEGIDLSGDSVMLDGDFHLDNAKADPGAMYEHVFDAPDRLLEMVEVRAYATIATGGTYRSAPIESNLASALWFADHPPGGNA